MNPDDALQELGDQIRRARLRLDLDQRTVAKLANVTERSVSSLENGQGSTLRTLVSVLHALGKDDWLASLEPKSAVDPLAYFRRTKADEPQRASARRAKD